MDVRSCSLQFLTWPSREKYSGDEHTCLFACLRFCCQYFEWLGALPQGLNWTQWVRIIGRCALGFVDGGTAYREKSFLSHCLIVIPHKAFVYFLGGERRHEYTLVCFPNWPQTKRERSSFKDTRFMAEEWVIGQVLGPSEERGTSAGALTFKF